MYQPTKSAIGIVQAIVNVPHELPGTSPPGVLGQDPAFAVRAALEPFTVRHGQVERFVDDHGLAGPVAKAIGRAGRDMVDRRADRDRTCG